MKNAKSLQLTPSFLNRFLNTVSPEFLHRRLVAQQRNKILLRQYDAAHPSLQGPSFQKNSNSANKEIHSNIKTLRENFREIHRNSPIAVKGKQVITNGIVGWGIEAQINNPDPIKLELLRAEWNEWKRTAGINCDFNTLQYRGMDAIVGDGETIGKVVALDGRLKIQLLESDVIRTDAHLPDVVRGGQFKLENGIISDVYGRPQKYILNGDDLEIVDAHNIIHAFRKDRSDQNRGVTWFAPVITTILQLSEIQYTQLMRLKLAASITAIVTKQSSPLPPELQNKQLQEDWSEVTPNTVMRINYGENVSFPTIPNPDGFDPQTKLSLRLIAAGLGITYESLSNDLSNVNFSSARIGDLHFRANVDVWRWQMFIPMFCEPAFQVFLRSCQLRGIDTTGTTVTWVPPVRQMIDPKAEVDAVEAAIRVGLQNHPDALLEQGQDPEAFIKKRAEWNKKLDDLGIILDSDPRYSSNGQLSSGDSLNQIKQIQKQSAVNSEQVPSK